MCRDCFIYPSAMGDLFISATSSHICEVGINVDYSGDLRENPLIKKCYFELMRYFYGELREFSLPLLLCGSPFQKSVYRALIDIPYGQTLSYSQVASKVGNPRACRAVGNANNKNPLLILVPCHRVISSSGEIGGYAEGIDFKKKLLEIEGVIF